MKWWWLVLLVVAGCGKYYRPVAGGLDVGGKLHDLPHVYCYTTGYGTEIFRTPDTPACPEPEVVEHLQWFFVEHYKFDYKEELAGGPAVFYAGAQVLFTAAQPYSVEVDGFTRTRRDYYGVYNRGLLVVWLKARWAQPGGWGNTFLHETCHWLADSHHPFESGYGDPDHKFKCYKIEPEEWP